MLLNSGSASDNISVLVNQGGGDFAPPVSYPAGVQPYAVAVADLNGDGRPDLAVANHGNDTVSVMLNSCIP